MSETNETAAAEPAVDPKMVQIEIHTANFLLQCCDEALKRVGGDREALMRVIAYQNAGLVCQVLQDPEAQYKECVEFLGSMTLRAAEAQIADAKKRAADESAGETAQ